MNINKDTILYNNDYEKMNIYPKTSTDQVINRVGELSLDNWIFENHLKIKKSYESYEAHTFYNSLEDIGIEDGKETIEQIAKKLPSYSTLFYGKTGKKESDKIYPFRSGTVKVSKMNTAHKVSFLF